MTYLARRDLQNVADSAALAACRVIAQNDTTATPLAAAQNAVATNLGGWTEHVGSNPPSTNLGAGAGLVKGIEIASPQVRVAVQRVVPTVLTQFFGRAPSPMLAQARCDVRAGGGLMPIAIQRYDGEAGGTMIDHVANKAAPVYPTDSVTVTWAGRYGPFLVPIPVDPYIASDGALADSNTGPEVVLVGQSADTNNTASSMRDLVLLDIRNVASQYALEYYNGADSQADAAKYMSQAWIYQHGYPGPFPQVGSQVAILDGASVAFAAGAMDTAGYRPGDVIAAIVYDGYVWTRPDFSVALTPQSGNGVSAGYPIDAGTAAAYTLNIAKAGPASAAWFTPLDFEVRFDFTHDPLPADTHIALNGVELTGPDYATTINTVTSTGWNGTLAIWSTQAVTQVNYLSGINVIAESSLGLSHGASSNYGFGASTIAVDYTVRSNSGQLILRQGDSYAVNLITLGIGSAFPGGQGCSNVPLQASVLLGGVPQVWSSFFTTPSTTSVDIRRNTDRAMNLGLSVNNSAFVNAGYTLRLTVGPKTCSGTALPIHTVDVPFEIMLPAPTATPDKFVVIQGYANFKISRVDANDVWGFAISQIFESYEDLTVGLRPRLVPW
ncbi:MAG: hypothetical protein HY870_13820 [Chloroflexi bacterium]|nr:hypothetical protein [Chloroflexota bacterium]